MVALAALNHTKLFAFQARSSLHLFKTSKILASSSSGSHLIIRKMSRNADLDLSGVYPPIPTPFKENEDVDYDKLRSNLEIWKKIPFAGNSSDSLVVVVDLLSLLL